MPFVAGMIVLDVAAPIFLSSVFVLMAASCWGLENNCTRMIAFMIGERVPGLPYALSAMLLGFVAYGLSIFFYVKAQNIIGAAKTSAYYAAAPFIGVILSFVLLDEEISGTYIHAHS